MKDAQVERHWVATLAPPEKAERALSTKAVANCIIQCTREKRLLVMMTLLNREPGP